MFFKKIANSLLYREVVCFCEWTSGRVGEWTSGRVDKNMTNTALFCSTIYDFILHFLRTVAFYTLETLLDFFLPDCFYMEILHIFAVSLLLKLREQIARR
jgi:hypothetical protein